MDQHEHDATPTPTEVSRPETQEAPGGRSTTARSAILVVVLAAVLCVLFAGDSIESSGEEMPEGVPRDVVVAVGGPTGSIARALPFASAADAVVGWFEADDPAPARAVRPATVPGQAGASAGAITEADFDRRAVQSTTPAPTLKSLLVTGDSMSQPLDVHLARALEPKGVDVVRDPHLGSGISKTAPVDWTQLAPEQIAKDPVDVVVVLLGANEGFPLPVGGGKPDADCCTAAWAAAYATRAREVAQSWLDGGAQQVLWLALPAPQDPRRQPITRAVNAAVRVALGAFGGRATMLPTDDLFTPGGRFRGSMVVDGREQIVRREDGIHLNEVGSELAAQTTLAELRRLYRLP
ncbi:MAG: hypothetical protein Q7T55_15265 [Solirubrobacteraceae bacterium]|nr:hypothetical protein [Solirubrobacteraceae bacterium]